jgi:hypothetical protein
LFLGLTRFVERLVTRTPGDAKKKFFLLMVEMKGFRDLLETHTGCIC